MKKIRVLLAEDEPSLAMIVKESLETRDFIVDVFDNGKTALSEFDKLDYDILVLDVMMPLLDGFSLAKEIRKTNQNIPIIFLTAKSQVQDVVEGFSIGGNDYLKKPFSMEELIVRIHALLNRKQSHVSEVHKIGNYSFDPKKQMLTYESDVFQLTHKESSLLEYLVINKDNIIERSEVLTKIWGKDDFFNGRSMDVFITKLRKKLSYDSEIQIINVRGHGFKMIY
jgi:DNA-binding response OmpR family regulator